MKPAMRRAKLLKLCEIEGFEDDKFPINSLGKSIFPPTGLKIPMPKGAAPPCEVAGDDARANDAREKALMRSVAYFIRDRKSVV
jgi:hypothetical protein